MTELLKWISTNPAVAVAILAGLFTILGGFLGVVVWPTLLIGLRSAFERIASAVRGRDFEDRYLEWVIGTQRYLPRLPTTLVPINASRARDLDKIYISLAVADGRKEALASEIIAHDSRIVIIGDPGAGKTTTLRFLALTFARARRNKSFGDSKDERAADASRVRQARRRVRVEYGMRKYPLPVFVYLNRLNDVVDWPAGRNLLDVIRDEWAAVPTLRDASDFSLERKLKRGECVFLLDAFDELGDQKSRDAIARHVGELAASAPPGNRFITTSRTVGYSGQLAQYGFSTYGVQRLSGPLIAELVTKWHEDLEEPSLTESLLDALEANPRIRDLATNPMLLSLIVLVQYVNRFIPERRHLLYNECVAILMERRFAAEAVQRSFDKVLASSDAIYIVQKIARNLHEEKLRDVARERLEGMVKKTLLDMTMRPASAVDPSEIVRNIEHRSQIIVERGINDEGKPVLAFSHLTFQEYLTAVDLKHAGMSGGRAAMNAYILDRFGADPNWWREVALLYAAQLDASEQEQFFRQLYAAPKSG
jgi:predicted NACHT family NTPase